MRNLTLDSKQRTRTADLFEKAALAVLIAILGARNATEWEKARGTSIALMLGVAAVILDRRVGRRH